MRMEGCFFENAFCKGGLTSPLPRTETATDAFSWRGRSKSSASAGRVRPWQRRAAGTARRNKRSESAAASSGGRELGSGKRPLFPPLPPAPRAAPHGGLFKSFPSSNGMCACPLANHSAVLSINSGPCGRCLQSYTRRLVAGALCGGDGAYEADGA